MPRALRAGRSSSPCCSVSWDAPVPAATCNGLGCCLGAWCMWGLSGRRSTLSYANEHRPAALFEELFFTVLAAARGSFPAPVADQRRDAVAATIGHARAELREIAALLANPVARPPRRRPRLATLPYPTDSLFPS